MCLHVVCLHVVPLIIALPSGLFGSLLVKHLNIMSSYGDKFHVLSWMTNNMDSTPVCGTMVLCFRLS